jgi:hypothetical protein
VLAVAGLGLALVGAVVISLPVMPEKAHPLGRAGPVGRGGVAARRCLGRDRRRVMSFLRARRGGHPLTLTATLVVLARHPPTASPSAGSRSNGDRLRSRPRRRPGRRRSPQLARGVGRGSDALLGARCGRRAMGAARATTAVSGECDAI